MESISCIICGSDNNSNYKKIKDILNPLLTFNIVKCHCGFLYLNPRPDSKEISKYYDDSYFPYTKNKKAINLLYKWIKKITFFWKYKILLKHYPFCNKLLDYGGGTGDFSSYMTNKNISALNYDPNTGSAVNLSDSSLKRKFDIITLWHSIEHVHDIKKLFKQIKFLLKEKGLLFIAIPNHDAYERENFFIDDWVAYDIPRHLYHFNTQTFERLLEKNKFIIKKSYSMYQDTLFNILMSSNDKNPIRLLYRIFCSIISIFFNKKKSSSLLFICKKQ